MREKLPSNDVREYLTHKQRSFVYKSLLWIGFVTLAEITFLYRHISELFGTANAILAAVMLAIVPVAVFAIIKAASDRAWEGSVLTVECYPVMGAVNGRLTSLGGRTYSGTNEAFNMRWRMNTPILSKVYVETDNGKVHTFSLPIQKNNDLLFKQGDRVKKLYGLPYPINLSSNMQSCAICGSIINSEKEHCEYCNHSVAN